MNLEACLYPVITTCNQQMCTAAGPCQGVPWVQTALAVKHWSFRTAAPSRALPACVSTHSLLKLTSKMHNPFVHYVKVMLIDAGTQTTWHPWLIGLMLQSWSCERPLAVCRKRTSSSEKGILDGHQEALGNARGKSGAGDRAMPAGMHQAHAPARISTPARRIPPVGAGSPETPARPHLAADFCLQCFSTTDLRSDQ